MSRSSSTNRLKHVCKRNNNTKGIRQQRNSTGEQTNLKVHACYQVQTLVRIQYQQILGKNRKL